MKNTLLLALALIAVLVTGACSSDSGSGAATPASGSGSSSDPFVIDVGTTYGGQVNVSQIVFYKFAVTQTAFYRGTISNTNGSSDLAFDFFDANGSYVETCDDTFTGNESCSSRTGTPPFQLLSGFSFFVGVYNFGPSASGYNLLLAVD